MKVICNRGALLEALMVAGNVVATRTPKPALQCVKLAATGNELTVSATDLEVAIRYRDNQVEVSEPGELLAPADKLRDIVRESVDDTLSIESAAEMAQVKGQDSVFRIYTQPLDTFPPIPDYDGEADFEVVGGQLKQLIGQTIFAAAKESTRYAFNGVLLNVKAKQLSLVSTDGRRLAEARGELVSSKKTDKDILRAIVPVKALSLIERLIDDRNLHLLRLGRVEPERHLPVLLNARVLDARQVTTGWPRLDRRRIRRLHWRRRQLRPRRPGALGGPSQRNSCGSNRNS
jgi:DNA polymerase-3 subunit beta